MNLPRIALLKGFKHIMLLFSIVLGNVVNTALLRPATCCNYCHGCFEGFFSQLEPLPSLMNPDTSDLKPLYSARLILYLRTIPASEWFKQHLAYEHWKLNQSKLVQGFLVVEQQVLYFHIRSWLLLWPYKQKAWAWEENFPHEATVSLEKSQAHWIIEQVN